MNKKSKELSQLNPFEDFNSNQNTSLNACIGNNSGVHPEDRDISIIDGYTTAVELLFKAMSEGTEYVDCCVYPFFFSCRHSIELQLKMIIKKIQKIHKFRRLKFESTLNKKTDLSMKSHSIEDLTFVMKELIKQNKKLAKDFENFKDFDLYIEDYYFDVESDAFRYTFKGDRKTENLNGKTLLNVEVLYNKFQLLLLL